MVQVTRKDGKESLENLIRRFNKKVQQSGVLAQTRNNQHFEKSMGRRERRERAIIRNQRKQDKIKQIRLGRR